MTSSLRWAAGVIEGFYGRPWSREERLCLFDWMARFGLETYFHAPKDDPHHRADWRTPLGAPASAALAELIAECRQRGISLVWAIHPGLDIGYANSDDLNRLLGRLEQVAAVGGRDFAVLFDDVPGTLSADDAVRFGSLAEAQADVANRVQGWLERHVHEGRLLVCPTAYCTRMSDAGLGGPGYLATLGSRLDPAVDLLWTGPEIISREISLEHLAAVKRLLGREPVLWDNLFADDYDGERFFVGPYAGRPLAIGSAVRGLLVNPNNELPLNFVPLHTLGQFMRSLADPGEPWNPRDAFLAAFDDWLPAFDLFSNTGETVTKDDLLLLADCFYLPHEHGDRATELLQEVDWLLDTPAEAWGQRGEQARAILARLELTTSRLAELRERPLFHAMSRRLWALREELSLLRHRLANADRASRGEAALPDGDHLPKTFRGGFVADLRARLPFGPRAAAGGRTARRLPLIRPAWPRDQAACYRVCLETGDHGADGTPFYTDDPDALGRIFVGPYLAFEPELAFVLEDDEGVCGYVLATADSRAFFARYEREWRPMLTADYPEPTGDPAGWTRAQQVHRDYHHPDYHTPEPYHEYPAHAHIDLLPRVQGCGYGGPMMRHIMTALALRGVHGVHLGVSGRNERALRFYRRLGFQELERVGPPGDEVVYLGRRL